jgi:Holliday junction resolvase RusA-like endonuclease
MWRAIEVETFMGWRERRSSRRRPFTVEPRKNRGVLKGIDSRLRQIAFDKLAILRELHHRLTEPTKFKTKTEIIENFVAEFNSGILSPVEIAGTIRHISRSGLYNWESLYRKDGLVGLVPRYKIKSLSKERATFGPLEKPIILKFSGPPRRNGKAFFLERLRRRWKGPPLECPIRLNIFYSFGIPKGVVMQVRMGILRYRAYHITNPTLNALDVFLVSCLSGVVFKDPSQIVQFHSEKRFAWWPQIEIQIKTLSG